MFPRQWRNPAPWLPNRYAWNGNLEGPSTAARLPNGTVVVSTLDEGSLVFNSVADALKNLDDTPQVALDKSLAEELGCPLVYDEQCSLNDVCWHALGTGIASEYNIANILRLMLTAKRCQVRLRLIRAGRNPSGNACGGDLSVRP